MGDFVLAISRMAADSQFDTLKEQLVAKLSGWRRLRSPTHVAAFFRPRAGSRFEAASSPTGLLFGADFSDAGGDFGAFVRVGWTDDGTVTVDRDISGLIPCWRQAFQDTEFLFSDPSSLDTMRASPPDVDWEFVRYHLCAPHSRGSRTGVQGVTELLPGWRLAVGRGKVAQSRWWSTMEIARHPFTRIEDAIRTLRQAGERAVGTWGRRYGKVALTVSGGLDSAIVLGLLRQCAPDTEVIGVNYLVAHAEGDERLYAKAAADLHGIPLRVETVSSTGLYFDLDEGRGRLRPTNYVLPLGYRQARERIAYQVAPDAIFSGTGGDHLFHERTAPQIVSDAMFDHRPFREILGLAHEIAPLAKETLWTTLAGAARDRWSRRPSPWELVSKPNAFLMDGVEDDIDWRMFVHPDSVAERHVASGKHRQMINMLDLQDHYWRYGPDFPADEVHPLMSQPVIEASMRIPTYWFSHGGIKRGLARAAFADLLPDSIRTRRGKSSNKSHWVEVMIQNLPFLRDLMLDGELARRGMIDRAKMEKILTPLGLAGKSDFAGFTTCICTEVWVRQLRSGISSTRRVQRPSASSLQACAS